MFHDFGKRAYWGRGRRNFDARLACEIDGFTRLIAAGYNVEIALANKVLIEAR